jgi:hypothetical protein
MTIPRDESKASSAATARREHFKSIRPREQKQHAPAWRAWWTLQANWYAILLTILNIF